MGPGFLSRIFANRQSVAPESASRTIRGVVGQQLSTIGQTMRIPNTNLEGFSSSGSVETPCAPAKATNPFAKRLQSMPRFSPQTAGTVQPNFGAYTNKNIKKGTAPIMGLDGRYSIEDNPKIASEQLQRIFDGMKNQDGTALTSEEFEQDFNKDVKETPSNEGYKRQLGKVDTLAAAAQSILDAEFAKHPDRTEFNFNIKEHVNAQTNPQELEQLINDTINSKNVPQEHKAAWASDNTPIPIDVMLADAIKTYEGKEMPEVFSAFLPLKGGEMVKPNSKQLNSDQIKMAGSLIGMSDPEQVKNNLLKNGYEIPSIINNQIDAKIEKNKKPESLEDLMKELKLDGIKL